METGYAHQQSGGIAAKDNRSTAEQAFLECLPLMAERAESVACELDRFVERFNGPAPRTDSDEKMPPACHRNQLERLSCALHRIEETTNQIARIG